MASLDVATLPDVQQAMDRQAERVAKGKEPPPEASKFLSPEHAEKILQPPPAPENQPRPIDLTADAPKEQPSKFLPPEFAAKVETPKPAEVPAPVSRAEARGTREEEGLRPRCLFPAERLRSLRLRQPD